jgi:AcrR family transcriptional regulator
MSSMKARISRTTAAASGPAAPAVAATGSKAGEGSSRRAILLAATRLATSHGLEGLSIGDLAIHLGMSKSGLYAHFKNKEELQLAAIDMAVELCSGEVMSRALAAPAGKPRLLALVDAHISNLRRRTFPGGCFFAVVSAELAARTGPVHDHMAKLQRQWLGMIEQIVRDGQATGDLDDGADAAQVAFEIQAILQTANLLFLMSGDESRLGQARRAVDHILGRRGQPPRSRSAGARRR